ncbi:MAG: hypothetical protein S4CHLAM81_01260 [Chlamydiales bacterium]|nr:hypothetical protein [Chlamydiales bacterium]MCH9634922.1 hypothetical protein [Chlamydiales bacterium]MCH9703392.1 LptF/LptG family permease [Chlamydiota bacterium]
MTILWRHLLSNYFKVLLLALFTFISILVVSRLETIAHFATMGAPLSTITLFTLYQIPYVLPIAIPLSSLLSALLLFSQMSQTQELTSLRASGFGLRQILAPIIFAATLLFCLTFYLTSEVATTAHLKTRKMAYNFGSVNPLILLQNARVAKLQGAHVEMEPIRAGERAKNVLIASRLKEDLVMYTAKELDLQGGFLQAREVALLTPSWERLTIESQQSMRTKASDFAFLLRPKGWKIANDHLNFSLLKARRSYLKKMGGPKMAKNLVKNRSEVVRRISVSFAAFSFTMMGAVLGMEISRRRTKRGIWIATFLSALALVSFFVAHELDHLFWISTLLLTLPHLLILGALFWALARLQRGIE